MLRIADDINRVRRGRGDAEMDPVIGKHGVWHRSRQIDDDPDANANDTGLTLSRMSSAVTRRQLTECAEWDDVAHSSPPSHLGLMTRCHLGLIRFDFHALARAVST